MEREGAAFYYRYLVRSAELSLLNGPSSCGSAVSRSGVAGAALVPRPSPIINQRVNDDEEEGEWRDRRRSRSDHSIAGMH